MTLTVSIGQAQELNGREAGLQATHQALNRLGSGTPAFGMVIASHQYQAREVVSGVSSLLGDTPMIGFSSSCWSDRNGMHSNSVIVVLLGGDMLAETRWLPGYAQSGRETGAQLARQATELADTRALLFFADGFNGDADQLCSALGESDFPLAGGLSSGDLHTGHSYQIAGPQTGNGAWQLRSSAGTCGWAWDRRTDGTRSGSQFRVARFARLLAPDSGRSSRL